MRVFPTWTEEEALWASGFHDVAGIDEVGRGPLAGPVFAAAVIIPSKNRDPYFGKIQDSKKVSPKVRPEIAHTIQKLAIWGIGDASAQEIDCLGIVEATYVAMRRAVARLSTTPDYILVDGTGVPETGIPEKPLIQGDARCFSIAAASIVAKVARDNIMQTLDSVYPGYGFAAHKGYPTRKHLEALIKLGPSPIHRKSFGPVMRVLGKRN
jgi:ribonuclease HII